MTELKNAKALLALLSPTERRRLWCVPPLLIVSGALEMLGLGALFLFTAVLSGLSTGSATHTSIAWLDLSLDGWSINEVATTGGLLLLAIFVAKATLVLGAQLFLMRFIFDVYQRFSVDLFKGYLSVPVSLHLKTGSPEIQRNLNVQPALIFNSAAVSAAYIVSNAIVIFFLFAALFLIDPFACSLALALMGTVGALYYVFVRRRLSSLGRQRHASVAAAIRWVSHAVGGIREVRILGAQAYFTKGFQEQIRVVAAADRTMRVVSQIPSIVNEGALVIGFLGFMLIYVFSGRSVPQLLPVMAAFALAGVRMIGMASSTMTHIQQLQFYGPSISAMHDLVAELSAQVRREHRAGDEDIVFAREIVLDRIGFRYPGASTDLLRDISLTIPRGSRIALLGLTGSGKTTMLSILLGLLEPSSGSITVDGKPIGVANHRWYRRLAYVPQSIFILDDTVRANVLFGRTPLSANAEDDIWDALTVARIAETVRALPHGLDTVLGENGARLSGGERQRIGIARALYSRPELLVLDEATAALDWETERDVLQGIEGRDNAMTLVVATHRLDSIKRFSRRYSLQGGMLIDLTEAPQPREELLQE